VIRARLARALGACLLWCAVLIPGVATAAPAPADAALTPAVLGTVKDSTGRPIPNAQVSVSALGRTTTTDDAGAFALRGLPAGSYHVTATLVGYRPAHADVTLTETGTDVRIALVLAQTPLRLSGVVVTASPTGGDEDNLTQAASELSGKALNRALGASIAQTLAAEPGVAMRFNGPAANAPVIRGLQGDRILVLQDGERSGDLSSAAPDHSVSIDPLGAQRIEVVRGPASLLYGNNALGGVVNVITNDIPTSVPSHLEGSVATSAESVNPGGAFYGALTAPLGKNWAYTVRGGVRSSGDLRTGGGGSLARTQARSWNGTAGLGYQTDHANGGIVFRAYDFNYGLPNEPTSPDLGTHIAGHKYVVSAKSQFETDNTTIPLVDLDATVQQYRHDELSPVGDVNTSFDLRTQTVSAKAKTAFGSARGVFGVQGLFKQYASTGDEALTPAAKSRAYGAYLYQDLPLSGAASADDRVPHLQAGARWDSYRIASQAGAAKFGAARTVDVSAVSGSIGVSLPVTDAATFGLSAARGFRAPTVEELFSNAFHDAAGTYDKGNPTLSAETNSGLDAILRIRGSAMSGSIGAYYSKVANFVIPSIVKDTLIDGVLEPLNNFTQSDATLSGIEGSIESILAPHLVGALTGDLVRGSLTGGASIPFMPAARLGGSLRYDNGRWSVGGDLRHAFAQGQVSGGSVDIPTAAYTLANLSAGYQVIVDGLVHSLTLRVDNLTDARYYDASSRIKSFAPNPGRNVAMVYKVLF
jgi:iron complex outermembrane receptor protein